MKIINIIEDNAITGTKYGTKEVQTTEIKINKYNPSVDAATTAFQHAQHLRRARMRKNNTKHK